MRKRLEAAVQKRFRSQGKAPLATRGWPKAKFHHNLGGFRWASTGWGRVGGRPPQNWAHLFTGYRLIYAPDDNTNPILIQEKQKKHEPITEHYVRLTN